MWDPLATMIARGPDSTHTGLRDWEGQGHDPVHEHRAAAQEVLDGPPKKIETCVTTASLSSLCLWLQVSTVPTENKYGEAVTTLKFQLLPRAVGRSHA